MTLLIGLAILGFAVVYLVDLLGVLVGSGHFFSLTSPLGPLLGLALGGAITYFGALGVKDALAPVKAHFQNPTL